LGNLLATTLIYSAILYPIIYIFPAYAANGAPVLFGGGNPLDFKKKINGKRIFGDNKTINGTAYALIAGIAAGALESLIFGLPYLLPLSILLASGAVFGDLIGSFVKRMLGMKSGASFPVMDQYGFVIFALAFAFRAGHLPTLYGLIFILIITGLLHVLTNVGAHRLRLKSVPW